MRLSHPTAALLGLAAFGLAAAQPAVANPTTFTGADPGVGVAGPFTNTDIAAGSFTTAASGLGTVHTIDFESAPLGYFTSLGLDANTSATTTNLDSSISGISNDSTQAPLGFNTTSGGSQYFSFANTYNSPPSVGAFTLNFATPVNAFGANFTGIQSGIGGDILVTFSDGSAQSYTLDKASSAGAQFFGFTDTGASISSISVTEAYSTSTNNGTRDIFGIDDIHYVEAADSVTPEPSTWLPFAFMGLAATGLILKAKRRHA